MVALTELEHCSTTQNLCVHADWPERWPKVWIYTYAWTVASALGLGKNKIVGLETKRWEEEVCGHGVRIFMSHVTAHPMNSLQKGFWTIRWSQWLVLWMSANPFLQTLVVSLWDHIHRSYTGAPQHGLPLTEANLDSATTKCSTYQQQRPMLRPGCGTIL